MKFTIFHDTNIRLDHVGKIIGNRWFVDDVLFSLKIQDLKTAQKCTFKSLKSTVQVIFSMIFFFAFFAHWIFGQIKGGGGKTWNKIGNRQKKDLEIKST